MRLLLPALLFFACALPAAADPATQTTSSPPKKLTLAQALAAAPPTGGLLLTVSAEQVTLPDGTEPPAADAGVSDIAAAFGDQTVSFDAVTAIAPSTMAILNTQPDAPNLDADLSPMTALNMLAASLDDRQWQALTSEQGLGLTDLTDDTQRGLFHSLFRQKQLWVSSEDPALESVPQEQRPDVRNLTDQIDATRIRIGQTAKIYLHDTQGKMIYYRAARSDAAERLHTYRPKTPPLPAEHGVRLKAPVPNTLKPSDLAFDGHILQSLVSIANIKTVGDLVTRIGSKAGLELYADPHYAGRTVTIQGAATTAPAADLLRALCLCVTGTFRRVGPAYVLTDDLAGVGTRRKHLEDWEDAAFNAGMRLQRQAGAVLLSRRAPAARKLPSFGDPLAVTPEEMAALPDSRMMPGIPSEEDNPFPFSKLTPAQQTWARQTAAEFDDKRHTSTLPSYLDGDDLAEPDLTRNVNLDVNLQVQLLIPSAGAPVDTYLQMPVWMLFFPGETKQTNEGNAKLQAEQLAKLPPAPPLPAALRSGRCRAVLGHPRSAADVDALVTAMQKLGLNQLWLDVFSNGVNHVKTSGAHGPDILTEALARTQGTGIAVYANLSLLSWGTSPPEAVQDLTIDGQTSRDAAIQSLKASREDDPNREDAVVGAALPIRVSPSALAVQSALMEVVQDSAARPGLAGLVWEDAGGDGTLGYTPDRRLAFLRSAHADPLDITTQSYLRADDALPLFDDAALDKSLPDQWTEAQNQACIVLLHRLQAAAQNSSRSVLPILMVQQETFGDSLRASWDDPKQPPPSFRDLTPSFRDLTPGDDFASREKFLRLTRSRSRIVIRHEPVENDGDTPALARALTDDAKNLPSDGFVLDFRHEEVTQGTAPLDSLVRAVSAENRKVSGKTGEKTVK